jgi:hypothetical protein
MKKPTRYQAQQAALLITGACAAFLAFLLVEWTVPGMFRAVALILCGANFSGVFYSWLLKASFENYRAMRANYDRLLASFVTVQEMNRALVENRIRVHMVGRLADTEEQGNPSIH